MRVPLSSYVTDDGIIIYKNREAIKVPYPFKPFILVESNKINRPGIRELRTKIPEDIVKEYTKIEFETSKAMYDFRRNHKDISKHMLAIPFPEQIAICQEDFYLNYPHDTDLILLNYDIETASKGDGLFTTPINNPILCIGWSVWRYKIDGTREKIAHGICKDFNLESMSDLAILNEFFNIIQKYDPDIILDYNGDDYDMPYIVERAQLEGANLGLMGRGGKPPVIKDTGNIRVRIPGRIRFDIYKSNAGVIKDQTLFDLKSKSLKELARHYKVKQVTKEGDIWVEKELRDVELPGEIENLLKLYKENPDKLYTYQMDDVYRTEGVGHVYMRNCITLAEMMKVPLENIVTMYSSYIPKLFLARNMENSPEPKLINTETNFSKYNLYTGTIAKLSTELKFEGAISGIYVSGYVPSTYKGDYAGMYPSIILTWNLGPDTTKLIRVEEYTGKYNCVIKGEYRWYRIPTEFDKGKYAYDLIVRVRIKDGFLKKDIKRLMTERKKIKTEMNKLFGDEKIARNSQQTAIKIILNSLYGILSLKTSIYGEMISGVMVAAMGRWCLTKNAQHHKNQLVNSDTDGLLFNEKIDMDEETKWIANEIKKKFSIDKSYMVMELESDGEAGYFYKTKNYILRKNDGKIIKHGSSIKKSRSAKIEDRAINLGIEYIFNDKPIEEVIREAYNFKNLSVDDFAERISLKKEQNEYDDQFDYKIYLAKQVEKKTGQVITAGVQMNYVICKNPLPFDEFKPYQRGNKNYTFVQYVSSVNELDLKYYENKIDKTLAKFGISKQNYQKLDLFDQKFEKKPLGKTELSVVPMDEL